MHFYYPLKPNKHTRRRLYAQRHYLAGEGQERLFPRGKKPNKLNAFSNWIAYGDPVIIEKGKQQFPKERSHCHS